MFYKTIKVFAYILDYFLSLVLTWLFTFFVICCIPFRIRKYRSNARPVILSIARFWDTCEKHFSISDENDLNKFFVRPWVRHSVVLCVGDGCSKPRRIGQRLVFVDIPISGFKLFEKILPWTSTNMRHIIAMFVEMRFITRRRFCAIEVLSPGDRMWRVAMLRWLLPVKLISQVRGNMDLIAAADTPAWGFSLRQVFALMMMMRLKLQAQIFHRTCDVVIGVNVNNMENALSNGAHPAKTYLTRIRVDDDILSSPVVPRSELDSFPKDGIVISLWSRIVAGKMIAEAIKGSIPLLRERKNVKLVIIGDGNLKPEMEKLAKESGVGDQIVFLGFRKRDYIHSAAIYSDLVIVPYGGSSLVEAAFLERPVVAFDIEWHREVVRDGDTGWLADYHFEDSLVECMKEAIDNREEACRRAKNLLKLIRYTFDDTRLDRVDARILESVLTKVRPDGYGQIKI